MATTGQIGTLKPWNWPTGGLSLIIIVIIGTRRAKRGIWLELIMPIASPCTQHANSAHVGLAKRVTTCQYVPMFLPFSSAGCRETVE